MAELNTGGIRLDESFAKDVCYGFRLDPKTGHLNIEVTGGGNGVVRLPSDHIIDPLDYKQWILTTATLDFQFTPNGHLELTAL